MSIVRYPTADTPWEHGAKWDDSCMPANIEAILHDQWKRMKHRSPIARNPQWPFNTVREVERG